MLRQVEILEDDDENKEEQKIIEIHKNGETADVER